MNDRELAAQKAESERLREESVALRKLVVLAMAATCTWSRDGDGNPGAIGPAMNELYLYASKLRAKLGECP